MGIGEQLKLLRKEKGLSKRGLVALLPLNYSTYANYESGFREPNSETLRVLAQFYGVSLDFITGSAENRRKADEIATLTDTEQEHILQYRALDDHGRALVDCVQKLEYERLNFSDGKAAVDPKPADAEWVSLPVYPQRALAGLGDYLQRDGHLHDYELSQFKAAPLSLGADFVVRVKGDSMEPKICDGNRVFVKASAQIEPDGIGVFAYEGEAYCRYLRVDAKNNAVVLEPMNKAYAAKVIAQPEKLRTLGLVLGAAGKDTDDAQ